MSKSKNSKRSLKRRGRSGPLPQMTSAVPKVPEKLLDGKTFTFVEYVPIVFTMLNGVSTSVGFNTSPNGYQFQITQGLSTPFGFGALWGEQLQQFGPLSLLYETYTVLDVMMECTPGFPANAYTATPQIWAVQTAESRTNFISALDLAKQINASVGQPLQTHSRHINFQPYLQQNCPEPYLLTYDSTLGGRQLFGISTAATVTPLLSFYQAYAGLEQIDSCIPLLFKLTARLHFRGRQNTNFTPPAIVSLFTPPIPRLQKPPAPEKVSRLSIAEKVIPDDAKCSDVCGCSKKHP